MKKSTWSILLTLLLVLLLADTAQAANDPVNSGFMIYTGAGDVFTPDYPDLSSKIGANLTKEDFDITYQVPDKDSAILAVNPTTGELRVNPVLSVARVMQVEITYTPKKSGVGKKTVFSCTVCAARQLTSLEVDTTSVTMALDQEKTMRIEMNDDEIYANLKTVGYDPAVVDASVQSRGLSYDYAILTLKPVGVGSTTVTVEGYNGVSVSIDVAVKAAPTGISFAADRFVCYEGEEIDLGFTLTPADSYADIKSEVQEAYTVYYSGFFPEGYEGPFHARGAYEYRVTLKTHNGLTATTWVDAYDKDSAMRLEASESIIRVGADVKILAYNAIDQELRIRDLKITRGADIASLEGNRLITTGVGEFEVTATNYDGSTVSKTFEVVVMPTEIILNTGDLTLEVGETFDVEVGFDQGMLEYTVGVIEYSGSYYEMYPVRQEGQRIIAQHPGTAKLRVSAGELTKIVNITVLDGDRTLTFEVPPAPFCVGHSFQMSVHDKTGKIYPATFEISRYDTNGNGTVTKDGLFTAVKVGYSTVDVRLEDGRRMSVLIQIVKVPAYLQHDAIILHMEDTADILPTSDLGDISWREVTVEIADESILNYQKFAGFLEPKKVGSTTVTIKSIYSDAQTTFTVEVVKKNSELYIATGSISVPYGYSVELPPVTNSQGDEIVIRWKITYNNPGAGNPNSSGFTLEDDVITCTWPSASCELTGTKWDGSAKVKLTVHGYKLPDQMWIEPEIVELAPGESQRLTLKWDEPGTKVEGWEWMSVDPDIADLSVYSDGTAVVYAKNPGTTMVIAAVTLDHYGVCIVNVIDPNARIPGDANDDGVADLFDALLVLQYDAGWGVSINASNADVNADGMADLFDALLILQYDAGWDVTLK